MTPIHTDIMNRTINAYRCKAFERLFQETRELRY